MEREKKLVLEGRLPAGEASKELANHPVFRISQLTKEIMEGKKMKVSTWRCLLGDSHNTTSPEREWNFGTTRLVAGKAAFILFRNSNILSIPYQEVKSLDEFK
jgi:hypothetical protein